MEETEIYTTGNAWQKRVYHHMASYLERKGVKKFGTSKRGNSFKHLLTKDDEHLNFITPEIYHATKQRFEDHKAGDLNRVLTNTAASQAYCFNLIIFLQQNPGLANQLFSDLLGKQVSITELIPEFTPNADRKKNSQETFGDESIGDQRDNQGTDADIAVFYSFEEQKTGVLLIEFKFIEAEFSVCSSYPKKENLKDICDSSSWYTELIATVDHGNPRCGYKKYFNWPLTAKSKLIDGEKVKQMRACPFRAGLNQLWRNILLAERVAKARKLSEFGFWVFTPRPNDLFLWKNGETEIQLREILTPLGNSQFKKIHLESIFDILHSFVITEPELAWLREMEEKYRIT